MTLAIIIVQAEEKKKGVTLAIVIVQAEEKKKSVTLAIVIKLLFRLRRK